MLLCGNYFQLSLSGGNGFIGACLPAGRLYCAFFGIITFLGVCRRNKAQTVVRFGRVIAVLSLVLFAPVAERENTPKNLEPLFNPNPLEY
jgi:hypothetical protein